MTAPPQPTPALVDLDALAAELERSGWKREGGPVIELMRWQIDDMWFREISWGEPPLPSDPTDPFALQMCISDGEHGYTPISLQDPIWQHALDLIRRHTQPTEGATE